MEGFDFLLASGAAPGLVPEYAVRPILPPAEDAQRRADAIRTGRRTRDVPLIFTVLCLDGSASRPASTLSTPGPSRRSSTSTAPCCGRPGRRTQKSAVPSGVRIQGDKTFIRTAAEIDTQALAVLRQQK